MRACKDSVCRAGCWTGEQKSARVTEDTHGSASEPPEILSESYLSRAFPHDDWTGDLYLELSLMERVSNKWSVFLGKSQTVMMPTIVRSQGARDGL